MLLKYKANRNYSEKIYKKVSSKNDLRKDDVVVYMYLYEDGILYDYYPKGRVCKKM
jgi:hypothetical protein